jgi:hypothetical protein
MKIRFYLGTLSALAAIALMQTASAQIVLTAENTFGPLVGHDAVITQWIGTTASDFESIAGMVGPGQTWDFTGAGYGDPTTLATRYHERPFDEFPGGNIPEFAGANFAQELLGIVSPDIPDSVLAFNYFSLTSDSLNHFGLSAAVDIDDPPDGVLDTMAIIMTPPSLEMPYPTTFGDTWNSVSTQSFVLGSDGFPGGTVTSTHEVVGWGTLVTPMGSASALMIRETTKVDIFGFGTETTLIQFLAPAAASGKTGATVAMSAMLDLGSGGTVTQGSYSTIEADGGGNPTSTEDEAELPSSISLGQNYPNPFNPATTIPFSIEESGQVVLTLHDVLGREIETLVDGIVSAGIHQVSWNASGYPSGLYQVSLRSEGEARTRLITLQK